MTTTVNYSWALPTVGASVNTWGTLVNNILIDIDANMFARTGGTISGNVSVTGTLGVSGRLDTGTGTGATAGLALVNGSAGMGSGYGALYAQNVTPSSSNYSVGVRYDGSSLHLNATTQGFLKVNDTSIVSWASTGLAVTGNVAPSQGVAFPASQYASSDPNTLDDYEEGTWTPNQGAGLTVVGAFSSSGTYVKIGRQVTVTGYVQGSTSVAVSAGNALTSNLPFTVGDNAIGSMISHNQAAGGQIVAASTSIYTTGMAAYTAISFSVTYQV